MLITNAEIISHPKIIVTTDEPKKYIIDFNCKRLMKDHEYDEIRQNKEHFYSDFNWDKWNVWWGPVEDISIDEIEYASCDDILELGE